MGLENVDEKRFSAEEAVAAAGTGLNTAPPLLQGIVSSVTAGNSWANVLRRYLIGESIRISVAVGGNAGVFLYPPGSDISDEGLRSQLEDFALDDEHRVVEIGEIVRKVVMKAKSIDTDRGSPAMDAAYSLREISAMAVRERLKEPWVD